MDNLFRSRIGGELRFERQRYRLERPPPGSKDQRSTVVKDGRDVVMGPTYKRPPDGTGNPANDSQYLRDLALVAPSYPHDLTPAQWRDLMRLLDARADWWYEQVRRHHGAGAGTIMDRLAWLRLRPVPLVRIEKTGLAGGKSANMLPLRSWTLRDWWETRWIRPESANLGRGFYIGVTPEHPNAAEWTEAARRVRLQRTPPHVLRRLLEEPRFTARGVSPPGGADLPDRMALARHRLRLDQGAGGADPTAAPAGGTS